MNFLPTPLRVAGVALLLAGGAAFAQQPAFSPRGKLLLSEDFAAAALDPAWSGKPGTWEMGGGAAKISELPQDKHAAVRRRRLAYHDAVFEFSFQFNGARMISLSINDKGGHVCRLSITPAGMVLQTDKPTAKSEVNVARLGAANARVEPGKWHKAVLELRGPRMLAQVDGGQILTGESPRVDVDKTDLGFAIAGVSALLKDVRVHEVRAH